jgi:xylulokinase
LRVPTPDRLEHNADEAWRLGPLAALEQLARPDALAVAVAAMVPSLTAVDSDGRPITPGLLYGDSRGRVVGANTEGPLPPGEAAEFLRWTAQQAPDAAGYWPAPAVANYALAGEAVIDFPTAYTALPLFDGGWNAQACAERGATVEAMPRVEAPGASAGRLRGGGATLAVGAIDALCEQLVAGADGDGDVLVLCGTTLIVWVTIPVARQVAGLWTMPTMTGKSQIGGASNAGGLFLGWVDRVLGPGDPATVDPRRVPVWSPYLRGERTPFHDPDRRDRPAGGGVGRGRGRGAGRGVPRPDGSRQGNIDHRRRAVGSRRARRSTRSRLDGPDGRPLPPVSGARLAPLARCYGSAADTYLMSPKATIVGPSGKSKPFSA